MHNWSTMRKLWLMTAMDDGGTPTTFGPDDIVTFNAKKSKPLQELTVTMSPIQDLHGYANPWPGGGGINKLDASLLTVYSSTTYGLTVTIAEDGFRLSGTTPSDMTPGRKQWRVVKVNQDIDLSAVNIVGFYSGQYNQKNVLLRFDTATSTIVIDIDNAQVDETYDFIVKPVIYEGSTAPTAFSPYSNLCPITGHTGVTVYDDPRYGGLVDWNQLNSLNTCSIPSPSRHPDLSITKNADNSVTIIGTSGDTTAYPSISEITSVVPDVTHVYLLTTGTYTNDGGVRFYFNDSAKYIPSGKTYSFYKNITNPSTTLTAIRSVISANTEVNVTTKVMFFDLTQMFGSTKADEIYAMEQQTAGSGLAYFKSLFPDDWYDFTTGGTLKTVGEVNGESWWKESCKFPQQIPGEHIVLSASDFVQDGENAIITKDYISVSPNTDYIFAFDLVGSLSTAKYNCMYFGYDDENVQKQYTSFTNTNGCRGAGFTPSSSVSKAKIQISGNASSTSITPADVVSMTFDEKSTEYDPIGKNLFNRLNCTHDSYINGSGVPTSGSKPSCYSNKIPVDTAKSYTFSGVSGNLGNNNKRVCFYESDDTFISAQATAVTGVDVPYSLTFTPPANTAYCMLSLNIADMEVMFEEGSEKTAYEPYRSGTYTLTVYSGTINLVTGDGVLDYFLYVYDGTEEFQKSGTALNGFYNNLSYANLPHGWPMMINYNISGASITNEKCSMLIPTRDVNQYKQNYGYLYLDSGHNFDVPPETFGTTTTSFKAKLAELYANGTPMAVCCKIATPITFHCDPQQAIMALKGSNTIWSPDGTVTVIARI